MSDFTLSVQEQKINAKSPKIWGWRWLFKALIEIQRNQQKTNKLLTAQIESLDKQTKLLRQLQPHKITDDDIAFIKEMQEATDLVEQDNHRANDKPSES